MCEIRAELQPDQSGDQPALVVALRAFRERPSDRPSKGVARSSTRLPIADGRHGRLAAGHCRPGGVHPGRGRADDRRQQLVQLVLAKPPDERPGGDRTCLAYIKRRAVAHDDDFAADVARDAHASL